MRLGLQVPNFSWPGAPASIGPTLAEIGNAADEAGFYSLWVMDHFFQISMVGPAEDPMLEGYSALNYLAAVTKRIKLGTLVTGVIYRHPGLLLKTVTTLDVLSGGRAYLGIGSAWYEQEAKGLGVPFPPLKERFERLEETLQIAHQMWRDDRTPFAGKHFQLADPLNHPQPISKPHPPILIGGSGEQKTLRLVAKYGDACNLFAYIGPAELQRKLDVLKQHCEEVGRPYEEIERTAMTTLHLAPGAMSVQDIIGICRGLADVGIQHLTVNMPNNHDIAVLQTFGREIIPAIAEF